MTEHRTQKMILNKNAIITGSNRGIGKALLAAFAAKGYNIWACARERSDEFEDYIESVSADNDVWIHPVYFNLMKEEEIKAGIKSIISEKKSIDVLINNAGMAYGGLMTMTSMEKLREVFEVNVFAQVQIMQLVSRAMIRQKSGCIINMCSVGGIEAMPGYLAYGSSKASLIWMTKSIARELGQYNIRVNGIAPGLIDTEMGHYKSEEELNKVLDRMSIQRMGTPGEIAKAALYIASDDAAYMTGHIMVLDGGRV